MKIIRNYVLWELIVVFFSCLAVLTLTLLCGSVVTRIADLIINWGVDPWSLMQLLIFSAPFLLCFTIPMSVLVSVLLVFGKLSADHEIVAMRASGISLWQVMKPILIVCTVLSLFLLLLNDRIATHSHFKVRQLSAQIGMSKPTAILEEGVFIKHFNNLILFIHRINGSDLHGVRIYQPQKAGPTRTIVAEKGELVTVPEAGMVQLRLMNGTTDEPDPKNIGKFYKLHFETLTIPLDVTNNKWNTNIRKKSKEMSIHELYTEYRRIEREHNILADDLLAEIHYKIAISFAALVLALVAAPLAIRTRRSEKAIGFAIAILLATVYWTLMMGAQAIAKMGVVYPPFSIYMPNILFMCIGAVLMRRALKY